MTDEGPTTVGGIIAQLRMDRDVWIADVAKTKEDAREIGALRPTIRVDMDTAAAMAKIEALNAAAERAGVVPNRTVGVSGPSAGTAAKVDAVAAAERRLAAAERLAADAASSSYIAHLRLEEVQKKRGATELQLAAATEAAARADRRAEASEARQIALTEALTAARKKAAETALVDAAATETSTAAHVKANEANKTSISRMGLITTAIATLIPMAVPLAAGAVGIAGAFTMMGVAGVLAVMGIKKEMADGTAVGAQYSVGLSGLKGDLDALSRTSAVAMLSSFRGIVADTNAAMPMLNRQVGLFSGLLGQSGRNLFQGTLNGARVLEPLLVTVGVYLDTLTAKFNAWTNNGGLQRFADYAMSALPQVEQVLAALGNAVMHILAALAPLGAVGLNILTDVSNVISALPVEVLTDLIAAITWGTLAFKAWGFVAPMLANIAVRFGAVGAAATIATGPIGWIIAGAGALTAVLMATSAAQQKAATTMQDYTAAVQADTGAIGENVRAKAAQMLLDSGALAAAKQLGISGKLVTDATLGNAAAQKQLTAETLKLGAANHDAALKQGYFTDGMRKTESNLATVTDAVKGNSAGIKDQVSAFKLRQDAIDGTTVATQAQTGAIKRNADAAGVSVNAYMAAVAAQQDTGVQLGKTTALMFLQNDAAGLLKQSLDLLNGKTLSSAQAQNQFDSQLANMSDHLNAAGNQVNRADALLTGMTAAAVKNRGELINLTSAAEANAQAFRDNGGSADATKQKLIDMKKTIVDNAVAHGEDRAQVQAFIDTIFKIPASIPKTKIEVDTAAAMAKIAAMKAAFEGLESAGASVQTRVNAGQNVAKSPTAIYRSAGGGVPTSYLAGGGNPFLAKGNDRVPAMLEQQEFVVKRSSALYNPGFIQAYNDNPKKALNDVAGQKQSMVGLSIVGTLDLGNGLKGTIRGVVQEELSENGVEAKMRAAS